MVTSSRVTKYLVILPHSQSLWPRPVWVQVPGEEPPSRHLASIPMESRERHCPVMGLYSTTRQRTHTGRTLLHIFWRLHHTRHWAAHIRSHLEKGAQIKSDVFLTPDHACFTSCAWLVVSAGARWLPHPRNNQTLQVWGRGSSQRQGCKLFGLCDRTMKTQSKACKLLFGF